MKNQAWILERFATFNNKTAIIWEEKQLTYSQLTALINNWLQFFEKNNIRNGEVTAICADYSPNACALLLALFINQNIVVPIASTTLSSTEKLDIAQVKWMFKFTEDDQYVLSAHSSHTLRSSNTSHPSNISHTSCSINTLHPHISGSTNILHPLLVQLVTAHSPGLILFSSGSTGESKATVLDVSKLLAKFKKQSRSYCTLVFLLLDHIGGINTILSVLTQGGTLVTIKNRDPKSICQAIERYHVELLPTSPTFLNLLLMSGLHEQYDLSTLKMISYGTEPMPTSTLMALNKAFVNIKFKQTYGLSELGILPTKSESPHSLWFMLGGDGTEYKVVNNELFIRSPTAMLGYLNAPSPFDQDGWFVTNDIVETKQIGEDEYLRILGRKTEIINVGGEKVYPSEVENILLQVPNVSDAIVSGKKNPVTGQIVVAKINLAVPEDHDLVNKKIKEFCKGKIEPYKIPIRIEIVTQKLYGSRYKKMRKEF